MINHETGGVQGSKTDSTSRYKCVTLYDPRLKRNRGIQLHRLVWIRFKGPIPHGMEVNHKDGDKHNNRITNLELVTSTGNKKHAFKTGMRKRGKGTQKRHVFLRKDAKKLREEWKTSGLNMQAFWKRKDKPCTYVTMRNLLKGITYQEDS